MISTTFTRTVLLIVACIIAPVLAQASSGIEKLKWSDNPQPASTVAFQDGEGNTVSLADFRGKVVVLNLWATWCAPCIREMPTLDALQVDLGGEDLYVLALSQDREGEKVARPFMEKNEWSNLSLYLSPDLAFSRASEIRGMPTTLIINKQGLEVARLEGTAEWDAPDIKDVLKKLMNE